VSICVGGLQVLDHDMQGWVEPEYLSIDIIVAAAIKATAYKQL
jgi:hypothetical protein